MKYLISILLVVFALNGFAQVSSSDQEPSGSTLADNVKVFNETINEAIKVHTSHDFSLFKEQRIPMKDKIGNIINIHLEAGQWYHFVFVGDPSCKKLKVTLFKEGIGDLVSDRTGDKNEEYATEFSFIAPITGVYEFTCMQKGEMPKPLAYLMLFKKNASAPAIGSNQ